MKHYKNPKWLLQQLSDGYRNKDISKQCNVSVHTISKYTVNAINNLSLDELVDFISNASNPKQLISPKAEAYQIIVNATTFLPTGAQLRERVWFLHNNTTTPPTCRMCDNSVRWDYTYQNFRTYCSQKCQGEDPTVQLAREHTTLVNHGVSHPASNIKINNKRKQTILEKYGVVHFNQYHIDKSSLNILQQKEQLTLLLKQHTTFEIATILNVCQSVVSNYARQHDIQMTRRPGSVGERELLEFIKSIYSGKIIENSRRVIPPQELDIFLPEINIAFEFNGLYWHSELAGKDKFYHQNKTVMCNKQGIRLVHILDQQWHNFNSKVKSRIRNIIGANNKKLYARKCTIIDNVSGEAASKFLELNHIQGSVRSKINIGLFFDGELVGLMTFGASRYTKSCQYELVRFCSSTGTTIVGGASRLFKYFLRNYHPTSIVSYSDKSWNTGNIYATLGFTLMHVSKPNYKYFKSGDTKLYSRVKFQKHKLQKLLPIFDSSLTEWENMKNNKYNRIWDCGNDVFIWKP